MNDESFLTIGHDELSTDLLRGAGCIAAFLFGSDTERRKVYHLAATSRLPVFKLGSVLCARRSVLLEWIGRQERRAWRHGRCETCQRLAGG